jgi:methylmalonyl-CoA mutase
LDARGVHGAVAARHFAFSFALGPQFFTEIAKFRALRPLWTRVLTAFGLPPEAAAGASVSAATGRWNKTLLDPHVNMLRVTTEALSGVLGGCDRLHIAPFDEVSGATSEFSRRVARNVHTLLAEEFNFAETADPAGGSWYVEKLTDELARSAWSLFQEIEERGGMAAALRAGYPQELVAKAAAEKREAVARRRVGLVGTNIFPNLRETPLAIAKEGTAPTTNRRVNEHRFPRARELGEVVKTFDPATRFAAALSAAREGATIGQLRRVTRGANTTGETIVRLAPCRAAEDFEALRIASAGFAERTGARPRVFLAKMGALLQHKARADFSAGFFAVGGFESVAKQTFATAEEAAAAAIASKAQIAVLCSTDETYPALVPAFATTVRTSSPDTIIVLAGLPVDAATIDAFREAGIDEFIHLRANIYDVLAGFLKKMGEF